MARARVSAGQLTERVILQVPQGPLPVTVTRAGAVATARTAGVHLGETGDRWALAVGVAGYNGIAVVTVTSPTTFTFPVAGSPTTPAAGTATYVSNRQGGPARRFVDRARVPASVQPWETQQDEILQAGKVVASQHYRVTIRYRPDVQPTMRCVWTPYRATAPIVLEIQGVGPVDGGRTWLRLDCVVA